MHSYIGYSIVFIIKNINRIAIITIEIEYTLMIRIIMVA